MVLINWGYSRWNRIKAIFNSHPNSPVYFGKVQRFYIVYRIIWNDVDPIVSKEDLVNMEILINEEVGCLTEYFDRRSSNGNLD